MSLRLYFSRLQGLVVLDFEFGWGQGSEFGQVEVYLEWKGRLLSGSCRLALGEIKSRELAEFDR